MLVQRDEPDVRAHLLAADLLAWEPDDDVGATMHAVATAPIGAPDTPPIVRPFR